MIKTVWRTAAVMGLVLSLGACGDKAEDKDSEEQAKPNQSEQQTADKSPKESVNENIDKSDSEMTDGAIKEEMEKEDGVNEAKLSVNEDKEDHVIAEMSVNESIDKDKANKLAEKYAGKLKDKYKEHTIDVQIRQHGDIIGEASMEKDA